MSSTSLVRGLVLSAVLIAVLPAASLLHAEEATSAPKREPIKYVRPTIPDSKMPAYEGRYYQARVPDTLDLAERARLMIEGVVTQGCDPEYDYETYQEATLTQGKPFMYHSFHDFNGCEPKYIEIMPLLRTMTGSKVNLDVDQGMFKALQHMIGEDGLACVPVQGRPWALFDCWNTVLRDVNMPPKDVQHIFSLWPNGRALLALTTWSLHDPKNKFIKQLINEMIEGGRKISVEQNGVRWFPFELMYKTGHGPLAAVGTYGGAASAPIPMRKAIDEATSKGLHATPPACCDAAPMLQGIIRTYRLTKDPAVGKMAGELAQYVRKAYRDDGKFLGDGKYACQWGHIHSNCMALTGLLDYADAVGDEQLKQIAKGGYEYARDYGVPLIGYFPHFNSRDRDLQAVEGCSTGDMLLLASKLSQYGVGDYYEDVDRCLRNHFAESQLIDVEWLANGAGGQASTGPAIPGQALPDRNMKELPIGSHKASDVEKLGLFKFPTFCVDKDVPQRVRGCVSTFGAVNHFGNGDLSACCHANAGRGLYFAWKAILGYDKAKNQVRVNMLLNRVSPWADVNSHIPYKGQVDIKMKKTAGLSVRIPLWVKDLATVKATIDGKPLEGKLKWTGRYVDLGKVKAGAQVTLTMPIAERVEVVEGFFGKSTPKITLTIKGNDVVDIEPKEGAHPSYRREKYRQNETKWIELTRFESEEEFPI